MTVSELRLRRMRWWDIETVHDLDAALFGPTEDYLVTREFRRVATDEQCLDLLRCCFLVGAADGTITAEESGTLASIADELGVDQGEVRKLRAEFAERFAALQALRKRTS